MSESKNFDPKSLDDLLAKVRAATGPERHLDALVEVQARRFAAYAAGLDDSTRAYWNGTIDGDVYDSSISYAAPRHTASVDAALSLLKRVLPGWSLQLHAHPGASYATLYRLGEIFHTDGRIQRNVTSPYFEGIRIQDEHAALAICEAILSSLKAST